MTTATNNKAEFSFANLSVEDAELPSRSTVLRDNPLLPPLQSSGLESNRKATKSGGWLGAGKAVTVPHTHAVATERLLRDAAKRLGYGAAIRHTDAKDGKPLDLVSVGGTPAVDKDGKPIKSESGKVRMSGGRPAIFKDGAPFKGNVKVHFSAKAAQNRK